jgi:hypothetical protein
MSTRREIEKDIDGCLSAIFSLFGLTGEKEKSLPLPYKTKESILTKAEYRFYLVLIQAIENKAVVIPKVNLNDVFSITENEHYQSARNRISQRHIDFLVCEENTLHPLFGIELDDSSHNEESHKQRDEFKNKVFIAATLPLIRVPVKHSFDMTELKTTLQPYLKKDEIKNEVEVKEMPPLCPNCGIPMVIKTAKRGGFTGEDFYACPNYPKCTEKKKMASNS